MGHGMDKRKIMKIVESYLKYNKGLDGKISEATFLAVQLAQYYQHMSFIPASVLFLCDIPKGGPIGTIYGNSENG